MRIAEQGAYVTNNSVYFVINKSKGGQALFKNGKLFFDPEKVFDNQTEPVNILINDSNELTVNLTEIKTTQINHFYSMQPKNKFISGLEIIGNKISSKLESSEKIKQDLFDLRENKDVDFSLMKPEQELKENSGVYIYNKQAYGIAGCYIKYAKDFGFDKKLLENDKFKKILRNMSLDTNGIAKEVVEEYEKSNSLKP